MRVVNLPEKKLSRDDDDDLINIINEGEGMFGNLKEKSASVENVNHQIAEMKIESRYIKPNKV